MLGDETVAVSSDYFGVGRDGYPDPLKAPQITREIGVPDLPHRSFVWGIGAVVSAVLGAGLALRSLREFSDPEMYPGLGRGAGYLPATHLLTAGR